MNSTEDTIGNLKKNHKTKAFIYSWNTTHDLKNFGKGYIFTNIPKKMKEKFQKL